MSRGIKKKTTTRPTCLNALIKKMFLKPIDTVLREGAHDTDSQICSILAGRQYKCFLYLSALPMFDRRVHPHCEATGAK